MYTADARDRNDPPGHVACNKTRRKMNQNSDSHKETETDEVEQMPIRVAPCSIPVHPNLAIPCRTGKKPAKVAQKVSLCSLVRLHQCVFPAVNRHSTGAVRNVAIDEAAVGFTPSTRIYVAEIDGKMAGGSRRKRREAEKQ